MNENYNQLQFKLLFKQITSDLFVKTFKQFYLILGAVAVVSFGGFDYIFYPEHFDKLIFVRLLALPVSLTCWWLYSKKFFQENYTLAAYFVSFYLGVMHATLLQHTGVVQSPHLIGLFLTTIFLIGNLPWSKKQLAFVFLVMWTPCVAVIQYNSVRFFDWSIVVSMGLLTLVLSVIFNHLNEAMRFAEAQSKHKLDLLNKHLENEVKLKTQEGIYLEKLSTQFSPQVIDHIKRGSIDLEKQQRREIACIFVDVQNSSGRATKIDHVNYTALLADFFKTCIDIFLKHNVTVGTYLGDGILAFTNAPQEDSEFRENGLRASVEILELHSRKKAAYFEKWRTDFNIRIGLDSGFANVGFFPSRDLGTYTALGETVNLTSRLCSKANTNAICTTKNFIKNVSHDNLNAKVESQEVLKDIKGYEGEQIEVFHLSLVKVFQLNKNSCPSCQSSLSSKKTDLNLVVHVCNNCGYKDVIAS